MDFLMLLLGVAAFAVAGGLYFILFKMGAKLERAKFERRNEAGVEEFENYGAMKGAELKERLFTMIVAPVLVIPMIILILVGIGSIIAAFNPD